MVDTPETNHPRFGEQPLGPEATERNRFLGDEQCCRALRASHDRRAHDLHDDGGFAVGRDSESEECHGHSAGPEDPVEPIPNGGLELRGKRLAFETGQHVVAR